MVNNARRSLNLVRLQNESWVLKSVLGFIQQNVMITQQRSIFTILFNEVAVCPKVRNRASSKRFGFVYVLLVSQISIYATPSHYVMYPILTPLHFANKGKFADAPFDSLQKAWGVFCL